MLNVKKKYQNIFKAFLMTFQYVVCSVVWLSCVTFRDSSVGKSIIPNQEPKIEVSWIRISLYAKYFRKVHNDNNPVDIL